MFDVAMWNRRRPHSFPTPYNFKMRNQISISYRPGSYIKSKIMYLLNAAESESIDEDHEKW